MSVLQKINLGTAPEGKDGDTVRSGNVKVNANVDAIAARTPLEYTYLADSTVLLPLHVGTRFGLSMPGLGKTVTLPLVSSVPVNACVHFFNVGPQTTIGTQGNDGTQIRTLNTGDWAAYIADGGSFWHVAARGRMFPDEVTLGSLTVGRDLNIGGRMLAPGEVQSASATAFRAVNGDYGALLRNDGSNMYFLQTSKGDPWGGWNDFRPFSWGLADGSVRIDYAAAGCYIGSRPTWKGGLTPWDSGNLPDPLTTSAVQAINATGGDESDLGNGNTARLSAKFTATAKSVFASASLFIQTAQSPVTANDFTACLDIYDTALGYSITAGVTTVLSVRDGSVFAGLASTGSLSCNIGFNGLVVGREYIIRLLVRKTVLVGPIYPKGMSISGMVA
ncbi:hypothetical protein J4G52_37955 [Burkholderia cenocepacia]|uniref:phage tail fiber protein n=1 Tax=Burkholderia cenocepacia TaxID=95486 RepID=UPI001AA1B744|nr:hypothetical protein [Burkholderia cenocepacia]MBO1859344.1 hypothetical protein [Burkholderia cenocepacia]MDR5646711.1 hypothetical protein [Burkholderia cenocepacia]